MRKAFKNVRPTGLDLWTFWCSEIEEFLRGFRKSGLGMKLEEAVFEQLYLYEHGCFIHTPGFMSAFASTGVAKANPKYHLSYVSGVRTTPKTGRVWVSSSMASAYESTFVFEGLVNGRCFPVRTSSSWGSWRLREYDTCPKSWDQYWESVEQFLQSSGLDYDLPDYPHPGHDQWWAPSFIPKTLFFSFTVLRVSDYDRHILEDEYGFQYSETNFPIKSHFLKELPLPEEIQAKHGNIH